MKVRLVKKLCFVAAAACLCIFGIALLQHTIGTSAQIYRVTAAEANTLRNEQNDDTEFTVMTWNIAHGRGDKLHQITTTKEETINNLISISEILDKYQPDFVGLQEVDAKSWWSGNFNHMDYIRENSTLKSSYHSYHINGLGLHYGTGILSSHPLVDSYTIQLDPGVLRPAKGATIGEYQVGDGKTITIVNLHLHWMNTKTQMKQLNGIINGIKHLSGPMVIMGDFNGDWSDLVSQLADTLQLTVFDTQNKDITHLHTHRKVDWILISKELEFKELFTLDVNLSDHRPVLARLVLKNE